MNYLTKKDIKLRKRAKDSHKGDNGKVLVVGGSLDYIGAVLLAGISAFRAGADLVVVAAPEKAALAVNSFSPDMITKKFKCDYFTEEHADEIIGLSKSFDAVLIGNGIGLNERTQRFAKKVMEGIDAFKVIDADAVKVVNLEKTENSILTPHQKELEILLENNKMNEILKIKNSKTKIKNLQEIASSNVFLIKGKEDIIISKNNAVFNKTGNEGMTKGGTGDVLAGITAGILAIEKDLFRAACYSAYINGEIGDILKKERGYGFIASDMVNRIPEIMKRHWR